MSRRVLIAATALALPAMPAGAQDAYGPSPADPDAAEDAPLVDAKPCEQTQSEDGVIVVCRELPESERYMSPLPRPVQSDRRMIPGLNDPPCWVTNPGPGCVRFGWAPEPAIMVDTTAFPEELSEEDKARVIAIAPAPQDFTRVGERVPIDLSEPDE